MDIEELASRLAPLEQAESGRQQEALLNGFMESNGAAFNNDRVVGAKILEAMASNGIDAAAVGANEVVQEILDGMLQEHDRLESAVFSAIRQSRQQVTDVQNAVASVTGGAPGDAEITPPPAPMPEVAPPPPPMDPNAPPPEAAPVDPNAPPPAPEGEAPPPMEEPANAPPPVQPPVVPSDRRLKLVKKAAAPTAWKPPSHMLNAIKGGVV